MRKLDLTGRRFGKLVALHLHSRNKGRKLLWMCQCDCGEKTIVVASHLTCGQTKSCRCLRSDKREDLAGKVFERFTALSFARSDGNHTFWNCICICGEKRVVEAGALKSGHSRSCGCLQREKFKAFATKHGGARDEVEHHPIYHIWQSMRHRCRKHKNYGGRGISVDARWNSFATFRDDMWPTYKRGLSIERKDNDGPYSKENCKWATKAEQVRNMRRNRWVIYKGERMVLKDASKASGISTTTLTYRLDQGKDLFKPVHHR